MTFCIYDDFSINDNNEIFKVLFSLVENLNFIRNNINTDIVFYRNQSFRDKLIASDKTIASYISELLASTDSIKKTQAQLLLTHLLKTAPYNNEIENVVNLCCCDSNLYYYSLVSPNIEMCQKDYYSFDGIKIRNFYSNRQLEQYIWEYEHNHKHGLKPKKRNGENISEMDLSNEEAQSVLSKSIYFKGRFYGFCERNQKWYEFKNHLANKYHGYALLINEVPDLVIRINENKPDGAWQIVVLD